MKLPRRHLPDLQGTKTEVDTANHIRKRALYLFQRSCEIVGYKDMIDNINIVSNAMTEQTDAKWWVTKHYDVFNAEWPLACVTKMGRHLGLMSKND